MTMHILVLCIGGLWPLADVLATLTVCNKLGEHVPGVHVQHDERPQCCPVLLIQLPPHYCYNRINLSIVELKILLQRLREEEREVGGGREGNCKY